MKLKQRLADFRVREILREGVVVPKGDHRVYRVTKRKRTSIEAAEVLAELAGVSAGQVSMAGLKDRQGVTEQFMSIRRGKPVRLKQPDLGIETVGAATHELTGDDSEGNSFSIGVRDLDEREVNRIRSSAPSVRTYGLPNYFDEQRFGNLRHKQGWIALELVRGRHEAALKRLLTAISDFEQPRMRGFKSAIYRHWGDWRTCRDVAGRFGAHHSVFEHLRKSPQDFGGAFRFIASRIRLIHLYAYQSHLWNRSVASALERAIEPNARFTARTREGPLVFSKGEVPAAALGGDFWPLPGAELAGVEDERQRAVFERVLAHDGITARDLRIDGVPGFALKPEPRPLVVRPRDLRVRPVEPDALNPGRKLVKLRFELPRGAYATLVVRRLVGSSRSTPAPGARS